MDKASRLYGYGVESDIEMEAAHLAGMMEQRGEIKIGSWDHLAAAIGYALHEYYESKRYSEDCYQSVVSRVLLEEFGAK